MKSDSIFSITNKRIHLGKKSHLLPQHHTNWRVKALQHFRDQSSENLHYSSVITLAKADLAKLQKVLLEAIEKSEGVFVPSTEEEICAISMDFFKL